MTTTLFKALAVVALSLLAANGPDSAGVNAPLPSAAFSVNAANPAASSPVEFRGSPQGAISWFWDFGDGGVSNSPNPVHAYAIAGEYPVTLTATGPGGQATASRILTVTGAETLRLMNSHPFDITLTARDPRTGTTGTGQVISQNDIYGIFSIPTITGNAGNPEVIVKMVDASGIGASYWVFYGALTDLTYTLSVKEVATGTTKSYNDVRVGSTVCGKFDTSGFGSSVVTEAAVWSGAVPSQARAGEDTLRLIAAHPFDISLHASDPRTGTQGEGQVIAQNDIFGIFSIPAITGNAGNPEVIVKMVDASGVGQNYWVFYAALTDLNYTLAVKETATTITKSYNDARIGSTVCGKFDTSGFLVAPTPTPTPTPTGPAPTPTPTPTKPAGTTRIVSVGVGGATAFVDNVSGSSFTSIHVGDRVQWVFPRLQDFHSSTSGVCTTGGGYYDDGSCTSDGTWDSGQLYAGQTFSRTFTTAGTYRYFCSVHLGMMTGTVQVDP